MGGGTYTGIEAVSNGLQILREPRAQTGRRRWSTWRPPWPSRPEGSSSVIFFSGVQPVAGRTLNAVLAGQGLRRLVVRRARWPSITIFSEGRHPPRRGPDRIRRRSSGHGQHGRGLLVPHRFASLSDRFTIQNGVLLMGGAAIILLLYSHGQHHHPGGHVLDQRLPDVFPLPARHVAVLHHGTGRPSRNGRSYLPIHLIGLVVCLTILIITSIEKFALGGWLTFLITAVVVGLCFLTRSALQQGPRRRPRAGRAA